MGRDKTELPFEVSYSEKPSKKSKSMKRIAVLLKPENVDGVVSALNSSGLEATIYEVKGSTKEKTRVSSGRGSSTVDYTYTSRRVVATVVNSDNVDAIVERLKKSMEGDKAVVMISAVDDLVMI